jgi:hypothetical protein
MSDLFFTEEKIAITYEKKHQFEIFIRTEFDEIINLPSMGWIAQDLNQMNYAKRYKYILRFIQNVATLEDLDFTGDLSFEVGVNGQKILNLKNVQFLKEDVRRETVYGD